jgi:DNA-binding transcriptional regulator YdaS (Cro superfamily)
MTKTEALNLLGGVNRAAELIGVTPPAIYQWPDELPARLADRVQAALWRLSHGIQPANTSPDRTAV